MSLRMRCDHFAFIQVFGSTALARRQHVAMPFVVDLGTDHLMQLCGEACVEPRLALGDRVSVGFPLFLLARGSNILRIGSSSFSISAKTHCGARTTAEMLSDSMRILR